MSDRQDLTFRSGDDRLAAWLHTAPRQWLDVRRQLEDWQAAIDFSRTPWRASTPYGARSSGRRSEAAT